ncbi:MAG: methylmalonyl-CoA epimerase [Deltaproteobacteria bacterium]|nr:methylmalonyl-CoA epimerase [Deltaproteobacteria bacterium]
MLKKIDHIGIAVVDLDQGLALFRDVLGLTYLGTEIVEEMKVKVGILKIGEVRIELLEATSEDSPIARFLADGGRGVHHLAFVADDVNRALNACEAQGIRAVDKQVRPGADGATVAFLHPKSTQGVLIELTDGGDS